MFRIIKNDEADIEIVIKSAKNIFQQFSYSSIIGNDISKDFENYIFACIKNYSLDKKLKLIIHIANEDKEGEINDLERYIHKHFCFKIREMDLYLRQQLKQWIGNTVIGILFLVLCLVLVEVLEVFSYINLIKIIKESLLIIGWVALWEPVTFILFSFRNMKRDRKYYKKLCYIPVTVLKY